MNPPDREGRGQSVVEPLGHPFKYDGHGLPDACSFPGCSLPRSAHTGGEVEKQHAPDCSAVEYGDARCRCRPPQPAPQGGGGEQADSQEEARQIALCWGPASYGMLAEVIAKALASRDSQLAEKDARITKRTKERDDLMEAHQALGHEFEMLSRKSDEQSAEIERLRDRLAGAERAAEAACRNAQRARDLGQKHLDRAERAEQERDAARAAGAEYIAQTDPLIACAGLDDPAASYCGTCRGCLMRENDALRASHTECLRRLLHRASQGDISAGDVEDEIRVTAIARAKALQP